MLSLQSNRLLYEGQFRRGKIFQTVRLLTCRRGAAALESAAIGLWRPVERGAAAMGKMMPLKWIEQAEARQVCVMADSERRPMPRPPVVGTSWRSSLVRLRSWIAPPDQDRDDNEPTPPLPAEIVRVRRARRTAN